MNSGNERLWGNNVNGNLNITAPTSNEFTPQANEWATIKYSLPAGTNKVRFSAKSGYGNNLYLDNICVIRAAVTASAYITFVPEGFYNSSGNNLNAKDTVRIYLRNTTSPFSKVDSSECILDAVRQCGSVAVRQCGSWIVLIFEL